jgi:hypothetical protein
MRLRISLFTIVALAMAGSLAAQTRSITNANLARYKDARVSADREYSENYERLGLPSPEEIDRRIKQRRIDITELAARLRAEDLERDRLAAQLAMNARRSVAHITQIAYEVPPFYDGFFTGGGFFYGTRYGSRRHRFHFRQPYSQPGYFAGGQFWPTGSRTAPGLIFRPTKR